MSDTDENDPKLDITDDDAEQLLADADGEDSDNAGEKPPREAEKDSRNWQADAERWKSLSRKHENAAKQNAARLKKYEDANKSESERLLEERDSHKTRAEKAEASLKRLQIAQSVAPEHATFAQLQKVLKRMAGDDDEALEDDARELWADYAPEPVKPKTTTRPKERLRGGGAPDEDDPDDTDDPRRLADLIRGVKS